VCVDRARLRLLLAFTHLPCYNPKKKPGAEERSIIAALRSRGRILRQMGSPFFDELPEQCTLMLVDGATFAPICGAWSGKTNG
jgi:hypothetical protein